MKLVWVDRRTMQDMKKSGGAVVRSEYPVYFSFDEVTGIAEVWPLPMRELKISMEIE